MCLVSDRPLLSSSAQPSPSLRAVARATGWMLVFAAGTGLAQAQTYPAEHQVPMGRVIRSVPIVQQVAVPRQVCNDEQVVVPGSTSGAGAVIGGIAGGAIGNQIGRGSGRAAATALGIIGGALLGNSVEGHRPAHTETLRQCGTQTSYEHQTIGYTVTYEYAGQQHTVSMANDPGPWVRLQVTPYAPSSGAVSSPYAYPMTAPAVGSAATLTRETTYILPSAVVYPPAVVSRPPPTQVWVDVSPAPRPRHHHRPHWDDHRYDPPRDWR